jgi:hypothetical protein
MQQQQHAVLRCAVLNSIMFDPVLKEFQYTLRQT